MLLFWVTVLFDLLKPKIKRNFELSECKVVFFFTTATRCSLNYTGSDLTLVRCLNMAMDKVRPKPARTANPKPNPKPNQAKPSQLVLG